MFYLAVLPGGLGARGGLSGTASSTNCFEGRGIVPDQREGSVSKWGQGEESCDILAQSLDGRREGQCAPLSLRSGHIVGPPQTLSEWDFSQPIPIGYGPHSQKRALELCPYIPQSQCRVHGLQPWAL